MRTNPYGKKHQGGKRLWNFMRSCKNLGNKKFDTRRSINSLKAIAELFGITIDELLSKRELFVLPKKIVTRKHPCS